MKALLKQHQTAIRWGLLALLALWCLWYARPVDIYFLLGDVSPDWTQASVMELGAFNGSQAWQLYPETPQEAAELTADVLAELEGLRFRRSPLEPLLRVLPPMGRGPIRGEAGKKEYNIYLHFYSLQSAGDWDTLLALQVFVGQWSYGPYLNLPLYVSHGREESRELAAFLAESPFAEDSKSQ